jgi:hypothetical protein
MSWIAFEDPDFKSAWLDRSRIVLVYIKKKGEAQFEIRVIVDGLSQPVILQTLPSLNKAAIYVEDLLNGEC